MNKNAINQSENMRQDELISILDAVPVGIAVWSFEGQMLACNYEAVKILGAKDKDDLLHNFLNNYYMEYQSNGKKTYDYMAGVNQSIRQEGFAHFILDLKQQSGEVIPLDFHGKLIKWNGEDAVVFYSQDMREINKLISDLREQTERAIEAEQAKGDFLAQMSHEIRTPMNAISGLARLVLKHDLPAEAYEDVVSIRHESANLMRIINDILDFSKIESGKMEIVENPYSLHSLINDIVSSVRSQITEKSLVFVVDVQPDLPCKLIGDVVRVRQIVSNLLSNAVKYTNKGHISLAVFDSAVDDRVELEFVVADTGIGIKDEDRKKLFKEFTRLDAVKNQGVTGTGLGLAIANRLAQAMDGGINVESVYGKGSVFTATIMQKVADARPAGMVAEPEKYHVLIASKNRIRLDSATPCLSQMHIPFKLAGTKAAIEDALQTSSKANKPFTHVFLSRSLYDENIEIISRLAPHAELTVIVDHGDIMPRGIKTVERPLYSIPVANILNGVINPGLYGGDEEKIGISFTAPSARVLIVDDITTNLRVAVGFVSAYGIEIDTASSGEAAVSKILHSAEDGKPFDLILMDHMMPGMDGIEATGKIREFNKTVPIIALTANAMAGMKEMFLKKGFNDYLSKPINLSQLNQIMEQWIPNEKKEKNHSTNTAAEAVREADNAHSAMQIQNIPGLNYDEALQRMGGRSDIYEDVLKTFVGDLAATLDYLETNLNANDEKALGNFAIKVHGLKSSLYQLGFNTLGDAAFEMEKASKAGDRATCHERFPKLQEDTAKLLSYF
ncbi:MAG: response regulator [Spirochaetaceae bacterium]|nr:response regulator [Spirochaetaceae bacterium]